MEFDTRIRKGLPPPLSKLPLTRRRRASQVDDERPDLVCQRRGPQKMARYSGALPSRRCPRATADADETGAVDDVYRAISKASDPEKQAEGKNIVEQLGNLKYEVQHDRKLS